MTILSRIIETKRAEVAAKKATTPMSEIDTRIAAQSPPRGFRAALDARAETGYGYLRCGSTLADGRGRLLAVSRLPVSRLAVPRLSVSGLLSGRRRVRRWL